MHLKTKEFVPDHNFLPPKLCAMISNCLTHLQILCDVLTSLVQLVLVQDDIKHLRGALRQFLGRNQLNVDVARLRLQNVWHFIITKAIILVILARACF